MRSITIRCFALLAFVLSPVLASAQTSAISGTVRDASGGVLPGVTVEVSSPALIEKTRSTVTSGSGTYSIVVKIIDIFGNDTTKRAEVRIK